MKLYRFRYSPYARKVQFLLDLLRIPHEVVEVKYGDRRELAALTGGYIYVPVLVDQDCSVVVESRAICERLLSRAGAEALLPRHLAGPVWTYHDFCDGPLEDVLFRIASPAVHDAWQDAGERALYALIKERKFGAGCIDTWRRERGELVRRGCRLLEPTLTTLAEQPFLFGHQPTLADAALYGNLTMLDEADPELLAVFPEPLGRYHRRLTDLATGGARSAA